MRNGIIGAAIAVVVALSLFVAYDQLQGDTPVPPAPAPASAPAAPAPRPAEPTIQDRWQLGYDEGYSAVAKKCQGMPYAYSPSSSDASSTAGWYQGIRDGKNDLGQDRSRCPHWDD